MPTSADTGDVQQPCQPSVATTDPGSGQDPAPRVFTAAVFVLEHASGLAETGTNVTGWLLRIGVSFVCPLFELPAAEAEEWVWRTVGYWLARANGDRPLDPHDPIVDRALDEMPDYDLHRQARLLRYAAHRARTSRQ